MLNKIISLQNFYLTEFQTSIIENHYSA